jgi:2-methylfumaryl-CoA hydratase
MSTKTNSGNYFEDFRLGMVISHATPRTVTSGDVALYTALYGSRFAHLGRIRQEHRHGRQSFGHLAPVDDLRPSNGVRQDRARYQPQRGGQLGYAVGRFASVYPGEHHHGVHRHRPQPNKQTGVVYVRSVGTNQLHEMVVSMCVG